MKRLLSYMCAYKKESILGPLFKMLEASFELFVPLVVANMVDVGIANGSVSYVAGRSPQDLWWCNSTRQGATTSWTAALWISGSASDLSSDGST